MLTVFPIPAFSDNYIWCLTSSDFPGEAFVVDPGDANPVLEHLEANNLSLKGILITHHHPDHTGGIGDLLERANVPVYGPQNPTIKQITHRLDEGEKIQVLGLEFNILEVPGHTLDHIAYFSDTPDTPLVFCGDTLFVAGCGRLFEGTPGQMHTSLQKLMALPGNTQVYCTHEYTLANLEFALAVEPSNTELVAFNQACQADRAEGKPTVPSSIAKELAINPFLRSAEPQVKQSLVAQSGQELADEVSVFAATRSWKDNF